MFRPKVRSCRLQRKTDEIAPQTHANNDRMTLQQQNPDPEQERWPSCELQPAGELVGVSRVSRHESVPQACEATDSAINELARSIRQTHACLWRIGFC